jgi:hypothetical protein
MKDRRDIGIIGRQGDSEASADVWDSTHRAQGLFERGSVSRGG